LKYLTSTRPPGRVDGFGFRLDCGCDVGAGRHLDRRLRRFTL